jgi:hypothetical protein
LLYPKKEDIKKVAQKIQESLRICTVGTTRKKLYISKSELNTVKVLTSGILVF